MINQSLLALACGDSYGSYYEYEGLMGVVFNMQSLPNKPKRNKITDDTKMATILLKHYQTYKCVKPDILLNSYKKWAMEDGDSDGIGIHTYNVLLNNQKNKDSQGNGALMRVLPFAIELIKDGYSLDKAVKMMDTDSFLTHKNKTISISNKLCLDVAVNGIEALNKQEYSDIISKMHYGSDAWVIHTLYIVIQTLKKDLSFLDGFKYIVSKGGDTDTNCAIYGAIKSAKEDIKDSLDIYKFLDKESLELIGENDDGR